MPTYKVELTRSARKEFDQLPKKIQGKVLEVLDVLGRNPYSELLQIKKLKGAEGLYRVRIGDYRIVYSVESQQLTVLVIKIGNRKDVYR